MDRDHASPGVSIPNRRPSRVAAFVGLAGLLVAGVWAWQANIGVGGRHGADMAAHVRPGPPVFPIEAAPVVREPIAGTVTYTGSVAAFSEEDIYPRVTGRIVEMPVYPGDAVRAGQVVARLDDIELSSRVREAEGMATTARASRAQMEADIVAARHGVVQMEKELAMVEAELGYARGVGARSERLVGVGAISRQEFENDRSMASGLEAKHEAARAKLEQARAMESSSRKKLEVADAMIAQSAAALRTATVMRDYVTIEAPSQGYVVKRLVAPGVLVQPGMAILKIARIDRVRLQANVGERDLAEIRVGAPVVVRSLSSGQAALRARVTSVFPFVDQGPRTAVVEALVENPARRLLPGQYVAMTIVTGERPGVLTVPRAAVARLGRAPTVWVARDGVAQRREVVTGLENADRVEIRSGLTEGERVVARGREGLYAGARVAEAEQATPPGQRGARDGRPGTAPPAPAERAPGKETTHGGH
jgi:multidrug efflux pump subunit AcrA (membrane-fusion protein)